MSASPAKPTALPQTSQVRLSYCRIICGRATSSAHRLPATLREVVGFEVILGA